MITLALVVFFLSLGSCLGIYFGYPMVLVLVSRFRARPVRREPIRPFVTIVVAAYNEEAIIKAKIENSLALEYPAERLELIVVSDGSSDATESIVASCGDPRVQLVVRPREGKLRAVAAGVERAGGEIIVLTDANSFLEPRSLMELVENFADPEVGGVCGNKKYDIASDGDSTGEGENLYWRFDKWQKELESSLGSIFAADGAFYALRRELFVAVDDPAQADDIAVSARVALQGFRLLYEPAAIAWEGAPSEGSREFQRKVRVANRTVRALLGLGRELWSSGFYSFELVSHKLARYVIPFLLIALLLSSIVLVQWHPMFAVALIGQVLFYLLALTGMALRNQRLGRVPLLSIPYFFGLVNAAAFVAIVSILRGERRATWQPRSG